MSLIPSFDFERIFLHPWSDADLVAWNGQVVIMGLLVCWASGIIGTFIVVR